MWNNGRATRKQQWFVRMEELAKPAIEAISNGDLKLIPERMNKTYMNWLSNIRDWCVSRQIWWGHRIPAYYCQECGKVVVAKRDAGGMTRIVAVPILCRMKIL